MKLCEPLKTLPRDPGIYVIRCGDRVYVGQSKEIRNRARQHRDSLTKGAHKNGPLQAAWNFYGHSAFTFEVLEIVAKDAALLCDSEDRWITFFKAAGLRLFNLWPSSRSPLGYKHPPAFGQRISEFMKRRDVSAETRRRRSESLRGNKNGAGYRYTPEQLAARSAQTRGRKLKPHEKTPRRFYAFISPAGHLIHTFGLKRLSEQHGLTTQHMSKVASGEFSHHKGWTRPFSVMDRADRIKWLRYCVRTGLITLVESESSSKSLQSAVLSV